MTVMLISRYMFNQMVDYKTLGCGKFDEKLGTLTQSAMYLDRSAHLLHCMFDDGQAKARAAHFARACLIGAIKTLEDARQIFGGNADTSVADEDPHLTVVA